MAERNPRSSSPISYGWWKGKVRGDPRSFAAVAVSPHHLPWTRGVDSMGVGTEAREQVAERGGARAGEMAKEESGASTPGSAMTTAAAPSRSRPTRLRARATPQGGRRRRRHRRAATPRREAFGWRSTRDLRAQGAMEEDKICPHHPVVLRGKIPVRCLLPKTLNPALFANLMNIFLFDAHKLSVSVAIP